MCEGPKFSARWHHAYGYLAAVWPIHTYIQRMASPRGCLPARTYIQRGDDVVSIARDMKKSTLVLVQSIEIADLEVEVVFGPLFLRSHPCRLLARPAQTRGI